MCVSIYLCIEDDFYETLASSLAPELFGVQVHVLEYMFMCNVHVLLQVIYLSNG